MPLGRRRVCGIAVFLAAFRWAVSAQDHALYDSQIWNRLRAALYERRDALGHSYGLDELDPLLWISTNHLLTGSSHKSALAALDEFLAGGGEKQITNPLQRAILQRDLWSIFDWCSSRAEEHPVESRELEVRLAQVMKRVALAPDELQALPDNYAAAVRTHAFAARYDPARREIPFLPPDLFDPKGRWVCIGLPYGEPAAVAHTAFAGGRSTFLIFLNLPVGREATLNYLQALREHSHLWRLNAGNAPGTAFDELSPATDLPQFPAGTQVALVRRVILIDTHGDLVPAPIAESVQIRVYRAIEDDLDNRHRTQDGFEFRLSRDKLFRNESGGLQALDRNSKDFPLFMSKGFDEFEKPMEPGPMESHLRPALTFCGTCHQRMFQNAGIYSLLSYAESFSRGEYQRPARLYEISTNDAAQFTIQWKRRRYDWGLLEGLWSTSSSASHPAGGRAESAGSPP